MKTGDKVRLISVADIDIEFQNWILIDKPDAEIGDIFVIKEVNEFDDIRLVGFRSWHPKSRFELVTEADKPIVEATEPILMKDATLRDYFAGQAMQSIQNGSSNSVGFISEQAYKIADAMMEERSKCNLKKL